MGTTTTHTILFGYSLFYMSLCVRVCVRLGLGKWGAKNCHRSSSTNTTAPLRNCPLGASLCSQSKPLHSNPTAWAKGTFCWCSLSSSQGPPALYNAGSSNRLQNVHARPRLFFRAARSLSWNRECPMPVCCTSGGEYFEKRPRSQVFLSCNSGQTISSALVNCSLSTSLSVKQKNPLPVCWSAKTCSWWTDLNPFCVEVCWLGGWDGQWQSHAWKQTPQLGHSLHWFGTSPGGWR